MINVEEESFFDPRSSCTQEEAAAKLLGWMRGPIHPKDYVSSIENGIAGDQLPFSRLGILAEGRRRDGD
jgi:hypothetical protein